MEKKFSKQKKRKLKKEKKCVKRINQGEKLK